MLIIWSQFQLLVFNWVNITYEHAVLLGDIMLSQITDNRHLLVSRITLIISQKYSMTLYLLYYVIQLFVLEFVILELGQSVVYTFISLEQFRSYNLSLEAHAV